MAEELVHQWSVRVSRNKTVHSVMIIAIKNIMVKVLSVGNIVHCLNLFIVSALDVQLRLAIVQRLLSIWSKQ
jgi:hypothetical protein